MSDWFRNPSSEIPDELWKAPAPMQRQVDAAVMWAELTGKHASAKENEKKRDGSRGLKSVALGASLLGTPGAVGGAYLGRRAAARRLIEDGTITVKGNKPVVRFPKEFKSAGEYLAHRLNRGLYGGAAAVGLPLAVAGGLTGGLINRRIERRERASRAKTASMAYPEPVKKAIRFIHENPEAAGAIVGGLVGGGSTYRNYRPATGGVSAKEEDLIGKIEAAKVLKQPKEKIEKLKKELETHRKRRESLLGTTALGVGLGATGGALSGYLARRGRG